MLLIKKYLLSHIKLILIVSGFVMIVGIIGVQVWTSEGEPRDKVSDSKSNKNLSEIKNEPNESSVEVMEKDPKTINLESVKQVDQNGTKKEEINSINYADIKGAVNKPGMYQIKQNERIIELVELAGGFTKEADPDQLNFARIVEDQAVVYVPKSGEEIPEEYHYLEPPLSDSKTKDEMIIGNETSQNEGINLNEADLMMLQSLSGIGPKKAEAIIAYREEHGSFQSIDELKNISGIGAETVEKLKASIHI